MFFSEKSIERVGGTTPIPVDFRLIAATNKTLEDEVKKNTFREDLYYRLNVVKAVIPPLRERQEDIPLLINHFIEKFSRESGAASPVKGISNEAARILYDHSWNGNVRELENVIERSVILASGEIITPADLPPRVRQSPGNTLDLDGIPEGVGLVETLATVEKRMIIRAMNLSENVQTKAAQILGIGKKRAESEIEKIQPGQGTAYRLKPATIFPVPVFSRKVFHPPIERQLFSSCSGPNPHKLNFHVPEQSNHTFSGFLTLLPAS